MTEDGRAVAIEAIFGCGECDLCVEGRYNLCATTGTTALGIMADGGMSEWFRARRVRSSTLPAGLSTAADACLVEPAAVAWHACRVAGVGPGVRVARGRRRGDRADGGGRGRRAMGAAEVSLDARYPHQVELGERLGATQPRVSTTS